jgi:PAS domain S-box-containing protein
MLVVATKAFSCPIGAVLRARPGSLEVVCSVGVTGDSLSEIPRESSLAGWLLDKGKPWANDRIRHHMSQEERSLEPYYRGAFLSVPIIGRFGAVGLLNLCRPARKGRFDRHDGQLLAALARSMAPALEPQREDPGRMGGRLAGSQRSTDATGEVGNGSLGQAGPQDTLQGFTTEQSTRAASTLFHQSLNPIFLIDEDGRVLDANPEASVFLECPSAELSSRTIWQACDEESVDRVRDSWPTAGVPKTVEIPFLIRGKAKRLVLNIVPLDRGGRTVYFGIGHDVTRQRLAEAALRRSEKRYRDLVNHLPAVVCEVDRKGTVRFVNEAIRTIAGRDPKDVMGRNIRTLVDMEPDERKRRNTFDALVTGKLSDTPVPIKAADGSSRLISWVSLPVTEEGPGGEDTFVCLGLDVTERHRMEEEKARLREQLHHSQRLESLGRLAGGIAHDFNNLLTIVLSYANFLAGSTDGNDPRSADIRQIVKAGERAAEMTRQLLTFGRKEMIKPEIVDVNDAIRGLEMLFRRTLGEDICLELDLDSELGNVEIDPGQLEQALVNLAVNSRDAMPRGGRLTIRTRAVEMEAERARSYESIKPGPHIRIQVEDTGCGIPEEATDKVLEPFYTTKPSGRGTGLGLAMVYGIVKRAGGGLWIDSKQGEGTTMTIDLPIVEAEGCDQPTPSSAELPRPGLGETILIAEDEHGVRRAAVRILAQHGYRVLPAENGAEAIDLCKRHDGEIDLLLTDVVMPDIDGRQVADRVLEIQPEAKTMFMSGYADEILDGHGVLPDVSFLKKPFTPKSLAAAVRAALDGLELERGSASDRRAGT